LGPPIKKQDFGSPLTQFQGRKKAGRQRKRSKPLVCSRSTGRGGRKKHHEKNEHLGKKHGEKASSVRGGGKKRRKEICIDGKVNYPPAMKRRKGPHKNRGGRGKGRGGASNPGGAKFEGKLQD